MFQCCAGPSDRFDFDFDIFLKGKKDGHPLFIQQCGCGVALGAGCWALDFDFDIFLKGKKDGHPLFIQQCACGVALGAPL